MQLFNRQRQSTLLCSQRIVYSLIRRHTFGISFFLGLASALIWHGNLLSQKISEQNASVSVSMLSGPPVVGSLVSADSAKVVVETKTGTVEKSSSDIGRIHFDNKLGSNVPPVSLLLMDGSKVFGSTLTGKSISGWRLKDSSGKEVAIPSKSLKAVLFKSIEPELENAWRGAILETKNADAVIVQRPGNSVDRIDGVIVQAQEASISFDLDGQQIEIPIEKLIGLVWFQRDLERVKPTIEVNTTEHSVWMAESLSLNSNVLEIKTSQGLSISIPQTKLLNINYASANIRWLSEVASLDAVAEKQIEFRTPIASLDRAFAPRFIVNGRAPLPTSLASEKDLYFPSPGYYMFRVPEGFSSLQCRVERTDEGQQRTDLTIEVWQDDVRVAERSLAYNSDVTELDIPLKPEKKTKLLVICKSKLMIGTEITWKQPRLKR